MIQLTNSSAQIVQPGQTLTLDTVSFKSGCCECFQKLINVVKLRSKGVYEIQFSANIASATADTPVQLAIAVEGAALPDTVMVSTPAAADAYQNVSTGTLYRMCCDDFNRISVINTGTTPVTVSGNLRLTIQRRG